MIKRFPRLLLLLVTGYLCIAQVSSDFLPPDVRRVGMKLACLCGACNNSVGDCPMIGCHYSNPARERIAEMQKTSSSDETIVDAFVKERGLQAMIVPPNLGFNRLMWWMPVAAVMLGLIAIYAWVTRMRKPVADAPPIDPAVLEKYRDSIDRDLAKLE
ncbi:MAG: cytochrome c-type biogenesis protein CcmH [Acidobacteriota bacterium]